jgi:hypothetical protein
MLTTEWIRSENLPCSGLHTTTPSKMVLLLARGVSYTKYNIFVYVSFLGRSNNFVPHINQSIKLTSNVLYLLNNINHYTIGIRRKEINIGQYIYKTLMPENLPKDRKTGHYFSIPTCIERFY